MAQEEKYGTRDRAYSAWHRIPSISRFLDAEKARALAMIDIDAALWVECDDGDREPLVLIETAIDVGQEMKPGTAMKRLAQRANLSALVVLYHLATQPNPVDPHYRDIDQFRIQRVWPNPENGWTTLTPAQYALRLCGLRQMKLLQLGRVR